MRSVKAGFMVSCVMVIRILESCFDFWLLVLKTELNMSMELINFKYFLC